MNNNADHCELLLLALRIIMSMTIYVMKARTMMTTKTITVENINTIIVKLVSVIITFVTIHHHPLLQALCHQMSVSLSATQCLITQQRAKNNVQVWKYKDIHFTRWLLCYACRQELATAQYGNVSFKQRYPKLMWP